MKKALSFLLSLVMLLSVTAGISFTAQAADGTYKEMTVNITTPGNLQTMYFTPSETGDYYFYSIGLEIDSTAERIKEVSSGNELDNEFYYDDFFGYHFAWFVHLTKNVQYAITVGCYNDETGSYILVADKNPIKKVSFSGKAPKVQEFTHGWYESISETEEAWYYDMYDVFAPGDKFIVTTDDGTTFTYTAKRETEFDEDYIVFCDEDGQTFWGWTTRSNQWVYDEKIGDWKATPWKVGTHSFDLYVANYKIPMTVEITAKGWYKSGSKWHYSKDGADAKGWVKDNGKWYYLNSKGEMLTGWQKIGGKWYYLNSSGAMVTGWQKISGKWYYFNASGAMLTGWQKIGGKWYFFNSGGDMRTGWLKSGGKWYYLDSSGAMLTSTSRKIGKKTYKFNASGVCTNP